MVHPAVVKIPVKMAAAAYNNTERGEDDSAVSEANSSWRVDRFKDDWSD